MEHKEPVKGLRYKEVRGYPIERNPGQAFIFNNNNFEKSKYGERQGTEKDKEALDRILKDLGFNVEICNDYTHVKAIQILIVEFSQHLVFRCESTTMRMNQSHDAKKIILTHLDVEPINTCCFVMVFLSHGKQDKVLMKKGQLHIQDDILDVFRGNKCTSLAGKPKIFIFQTCRGKKSEAVAHESKCDERVISDADSELTEESGCSNITPAGADFLVCYSSSNGYKSYRSKEDGSWFIQTITQVLDYCVEYPSPNHDFHSLMTLVADNVAAKCHVDKSKNHLLQIPCVVSTLKKKLCFPKLCTISSYQQPEADTEDEDDEDDAYGDAAQRIKIDDEVKEATNTVLQ